MLSTSEIRDLIESGELQIETYGTELHLGPSSLDVHLSGVTKAPVHFPGVVEIDDQETYPAYETYNNERPVVPSKGFVLGSTVEVFNLPGDVTALLHGRSSIGRLGLFIENAGLVDRGFTGELTLELVNPMPYDIELVSGMRIGQLTFHRHDVEDGPGYPLHGKYQGQVYPTESAAWADEEFQAVEGS
jgi:dCTP deaminase